MPNIRKILTDDEKAEKLRLKREQDAQRKREAYHKKKEERLSQGAATVHTPEELKKIALRHQRKYRENEEYREQKKAKALEYYHKKKDEQPKTPKEHKPVGRPRKYIEE